MRLSFWSKPYRYLICFLTLLLFEINVFNSQDDFFCGKLKDKFCLLVHPFLLKIIINNFLIQIFT